MSLESILGLVKDLERAGKHVETEAELTVALVDAARFAEIERVVRKATDDKTWRNYFSELLDLANKLEIKNIYLGGGNTQINCADLLGITIENTNYDPRAQLFNERGFTRRMLGGKDKANYDLALQDFEAALASNPDQEQAANAWINKADIYRVGKKEFLKAHLCLDEALTYTGNQTLLHAKALDQRGLVYAGQIDNNSAIVYYKRAKEIGEKLLATTPEDKEVQNRFGQVILHLGTAYVQLKDAGRVDEAYMEILSAFDIFQRQKDENGIVNAILVLGRISAIRNDYTTAAATYEQAMTHLNPDQDKRGVAVLSLHLGASYLELHDVRSAAPHLKTAFDYTAAKNITAHDLGVLVETTMRIAELYSSPNYGQSDFEQEAIPEPNSNYDAFLQSTIDALNPQQNKREIACLSLYLADRKTALGHTRVFIDAIPYMTKVAQAVLTNDLNQTDFKALRGAWNNLMKNYREAQKESRMAPIFNDIEGFEQVNRCFDEVNVL